MRPLRLSDATRPSLIEELERRALLSSVLTNSTLYITGTPGNDVIGITAKSSRLRVVINGALEQFSLAAVTRIEIQAGDGNDIAGWSAISIPTYINAGAGNDSVVGGLGNDSLTGAAGRDTLRGGAGNDRINGANTADILYGDEGDDVLYGGFGDDFIDGGSGRDRLFGEDGADRLYGQSGNDGIYGGDGADRIYGMTGNDILSGEGGNDRIYGGDGDDQIYGGAGIDGLYGEAGDDKFFAKDNTADAIDGSDGADSAEVDGTLDNVVSVESVDGVTNVQSKLPRAVSVNDESLWDEHFTDTLATLKSLGVKAVRLWLNVDDFNERPNAWDVVDEHDIVKTWQSTITNVRAVIGGLAMKRAFELKRAGMTILMTVNRYGGAVPGSADEVKNYYKHILSSTETKTSKQTLKDVVDYWEVGNEVDAPVMWQPSGVNKTTGLQQYVDKLLLPASEVLHSGTPATWEKVVSASVRYNPDDLNVILKQLKTENRLDAIDFIGFHPYGMFDPTNPSVNEIKTRTDGAVALSNLYGKKLIATEWNVRGYPNDGSKNTLWATAIDEIYRTEILPNYEIGFYFNLTNNFAARGGNTSARPAGLLKHSSSMNISPTSSIDDQVTYFRSALVTSDPFYSTFNAWQQIQS